MMGVTIKGTQYRSLNNGFKWTKLRKRLRLSKKQKNERFNGVTNIFQNKADANEFLLIGDEKVSFITRDCGATFSSFLHEKGVFKVQFHPEKQGIFLMLVAKDRKCLTPLCLPNKTLYLAEQYGKVVKKV